MGSGSTCCRLAGCLGLWLVLCLKAAWASGWFLADTPGPLARLTRKKFLRFLNSQELFLCKADRDPRRLLLPRNLT